MGMLSWTPSRPDLWGLESLPVNYIEISWDEAGCFITGSPSRRLLETNLLKAAFSAASRGCSMGTLPIMDAAELCCNLPLAMSLDDHTVCSVLGRVASLTESLITSGVL